MNSELNSPTDPFHNLRASKPADQVHRLTDLEALKL